RKWIRIFPYTMLFIYIIYIAYHILGQIYNQMASHYKSNNYNEQWFVLLSLFIPAIILLTLSLIQLKGRLKELFTRFKETILRTAILFAVSLFLVLILDWLRVGILLGPSLFLYFLMALGVSLFSAFFRISHLWAGGFITLFILWVILYLFQSGGSHKILSSQVIITSIQDILIYYATPFSAIYMTIAYLYPGLYASKWRDTLARFHFILSHILLLALVIFQLWYYLIIKFQAGDLLPASRDLMAKENDKLLAYMTYGLFFTQLIWLMNLIYGVIRGDLTRRLPQHSKQALSR
ncbi:MAG: hypothetical protein OEZ36_05055, partial [Spirochaetota bacterium]|nr:hypothetical protein [Spirochaetota bacterium]